MNSVMVRPNNIFDQAVDEPLNDELQIYDYSHYPVPIKDSKTIRIFYNNVNGLQINGAIESIVNNRSRQQKDSFISELEMYTKLEAYIKQMYDWNIDISAMTEPCIEWRNVIPRKIFQEITRKYDNTANWTMATSSCYSGSFVKPGGAAILSTGRMSGTIVERGTDPWGYGRWAYVRYAGKAGRSLLAISCYRVGSRTVLAGSSTAWYQQMVLLSKDDRDISPEHATLQDLEDWIRKEQTAETEIILFIDANEQWTYKSKIAQFAARLDICNLNIDGEYNFPPYHPCITNSARDTTIDFY